MNFLFNTGDEADFPVDDPRDSIPATLGKSRSHIERGVIVEATDYRGDHLQVNERPRYLRYRSLFCSNLDERLIRLDYHRNLQRT